MTPWLHAHDYAPTRTQNCCVESTMRTAYEKGFNVITLTDATATTSAEGQAVTKGSYGFFSTPMTVEEYEKTLA